MSGSYDIYNSHFGFETRPFSLVPDPEFIYWSPAHRRAWTMLEYGILTNAPITLITGEVGAGKTTLLQHLLRSMDEDVRIGLISNSHGSRGELLQWVLLALGQEVNPEAGYVRLFGQLQDYLIGEYAAGRRVVLIFDEAQNLGRDSLEELRMFTNINSGRDELVQLVLVGQPELRDFVRRPDMTQFAQRVASSFHLPALDAAAVADYIAHRLTVAGGRPDVFSEDAARAVHAATGGVPRLVNQLCDLALLYAFEAGQDRVTEAAVRQVLEDGTFFAGGAGNTLRLVHRVEDATGTEPKKE
ncbi:MAG: ExeA family protein [Pseudooceanicola nanhaiensis]